MNRIFLTLSIISNAALAATFVLGWAVRDLSLPDSSGVDLSVHFLCGVAALTLAMLVHAIVLTYFMGTGRWIEETTTAYRMGTAFREQNIRLKYKTIPGMVGCLLLLIVVGGFGAAADPGAALDFAAAKTIHMVLGTLALLTNIAVSAREYLTILANGQLINEIMSQVQSVRRERGLDQDPSTRPVSGTEPQA